MSKDERRTDDEVIHIALVFDENYWAPAYATMRSVCLGTRRRKNLLFHVCHTGLSASARADLDKIHEEYGASIKYYDVSKDKKYLRMVDVHVKKMRVSSVAQARMLLGYILPEDIERLIYLDSDLIVRERIEELYEADLEGYPLGAVRNGRTFRVLGGNNMRQFKDLFDTADDYFNSGVLLIDLKQWREMEIMDKLAELIESGLIAKLIRPYADQHVMNYIFKRNWKKLDPLWNVRANWAIDAMHPKILHYMGYDKPWELFSKAHNASTYRHIMTHDLFFRYWRFRFVRRWKKRLGLLSR